MSIIKKAVEKYLAIKCESKKAIQISDVMRKISPYLMENAISMKKLDYALQSNDSLLQTLNEVLQEDYDKDAIQWILMPLKIYQRDTDFDSASFCDNLIKRKKSSYDHYYMRYNNVELSSILEKVEDDIERVCFMMPNTFNVMPWGNLLDSFPALKYVAREFPIQDFLDSIHFEGSIEEYMKENFSSLLFCNPKLLSILVQNNIENHYGFNQEQVESLLPFLENESFLSPEFLEQFLFFASSSGQSCNARVSLLPVFMEVRGSVFPNWYFDMPKSFWIYLSDQIGDLQQRADIVCLLSSQTLESFHLARHVRAFESEYKHRLAHPQLSRESQDSLVSSEMEKVYSMLLTWQFLHISAEQKDCLLTQLSGDSFDYIDQFQDLFASDCFPLKKIEGQQNFSKFIQFLSVDERQLVLRKQVLSSVMSQFSSQHFHDFLDYLVSCNLKTKKEYAAHTAYFRTHSIDSFFDSFFEKSDWRRRCEILTLKTDDKEKKKQQLRFCKKACDNLDESVYDHIREIFEFSNNVEQLKGVVHLILNPLFAILSSDSQLEALSIFSSDLLQFYPEDAKGSDLDITVYDAPSVEERLDVGSYVKCKGMTRRGPVEVCVRKK